MAGSSFGAAFRLTTFGESHGVAIGGVIDGCPANFPIDTNAIQHQLNRRKPGQSQLTSQRREPDNVEILSGIFQGKTTGAPIGFTIHNLDQKSKDYSSIKTAYRPGHADFTYDQKYATRDYRGGGRSSARETASRVVAGSVARQILQSMYGVAIQAWVGQVGNICAPTFGSADFDTSCIEHNTMFCPNTAIAQTMQGVVTAARADRNSVGAKVCVVATGTPAGWGEPVFDKLDALIAQAMMSINAAKGVGIGAGFACVAAQGSTYHDQMSPTGFTSNTNGGTLGGISTGQDIYAEIAFKPTPSIAQPLHSINTVGDAVAVTTKGRHDPCVGIRAVPIVEAMLALVLCDLSLRQQAQIFVKPNNNLML